NIGFYIFPNIPDVHKYWYSQTGFNSDDFDHLKVFATGNPNQYLICWEDLPEGGDKDFQDLVIKVTLPKNPPEINCPSSLNFSSCIFPNTFCFGISASDNCGDLEYEIIEGNASVEGSTVCLTASQAGQYTVKVAAYNFCGLADTCTVTVNVTLEGAGPISVECRQDTTVFVAGIGQEICVPGFGCSFDSCYVYPANEFTLNGNSVCFVPDSLGIYEIFFVAIDACGGRDTCSTKIYVMERTETCDSVKVSNHFTLMFEGVTYNSLEGTSKWEYKLLWDGTPPELSYFFIELCTLLTNANLVSVEPDFGSIGYNGNADLWGIKWDGISGTPANTPVYFSFTLDQMLAESSNLFAPKAGVNQNLATICGPSIDCETLIDSCESNSPPSVECPGDTTLVVNSLSEICLDGFAAFDVDGNILSITATGGIYGNGRVCFVPVEGGNVITFVAIDSCGAADTCQTNVFVKRNNPPTCQIPPENSVIEICAGQDTCLRVSALDPDNNLERCTVVDGPGEIVDDTLWCYTPSGNETVTVTIECVDSLGLTCTGQFTVEFRTNQKPELGDVDVTDVFLCNSQQPVCVELDINSYGLPFEVSSLYGEFNPNDSSVCFSVDTSGTYYNRVILTNSCGQADTVEYVIDVVINSAPVAVCPPIDTIEICYTQEQVCVAGFDYFDNNDNIVSVDLIGGNFAGDSVCFNPLIGENNLTLVVTDNCGLVDTCRTLVFVKASSPPIIPPIDDQEISICNPDTFCFDISVIEPVNNLDSVWTNIGEINNGVLCVSVDTSGIYQVVVYAMNKCLEISSDSFKVFVAINEPPLVSLGEDFATQ
ncbi:MAG TPA: DUF4114 domain-containing protein, partial [candidate division Zixibacteria bacterium]|nr:DUF4114 domain-containing protein [candidate division Zixibacteria bacterium]